MMVSFIGSNQGARKPAFITEAMRRVAERVYINMPWSHLGRYLEVVLENSLNIEIGFGAEELESTPARVVAATMGALRARGCGISVHGPFWDLCPGSVDPAIREVSRSRLQKLFDLMEEVRPVQIVCHTGFDPRHHRGHRAAWVENSVALWEFFAGRAEKIGAPLVIENVWEEDPQLHLELLERISSSWFGFCLDMGHQHSFSKTSLADWLDATSRYIKEIHLHDNDGSFDLHMPIGEGTIDFDFLFKHLSTGRQRPLLTLEPHREEHLYRSLDALSRIESFQPIL